MKNKIFTIDQLISWLNKGFISFDEYNYYSNKLFNAGLQKIKEIKADIQKSLREQEQAMKMIQEDEHWGINVAHELQGGLTEPSY